MFHSWPRILCRLALVACAFSVASPAATPRPVPPRLVHPLLQEVPTAGRGGGPWSRLQKPLHRVAACFGLVLGVTGVFLAFASGPLIPVVAWAVAGMALQICGG